ncbi:MAG: hypothetical protein ACJAS1_001779 [Oleiphilaceae bacterium]|jgi:hypothetical protein
MLSQLPENHESRFINLMHGTYSDILFILLPFIVMWFQYLWVDSQKSILLMPEISIIAAILSGLCVSKFVLGLINGQGLTRYKERIVFFIAFTIFAVLLPSILLSLKLSSEEVIPQFVAYVQPLLLLVSIVLYACAVNVSKKLNHGSIDETAPSDEIKPDAGIAQQAGSGSEKSDPEESNPQSIPNEATNP